MLPFSEGTVLPCPENLICGVQTAAWPPRGLLLNPLVPARCLAGPLWSQALPTLPVLLSHDHATLGCAPGGFSSSPWKVPESSFCLFPKFWGPGGHLGLGCSCFSFNGAHLPTLASCSTPGSPWPPCPIHPCIHFYVGYGHTHEYTHECEAVCVHVYMCKLKHARYMCISMYSCVQVQLLVLRNAGGGVSWGDLGPPSLQGGAGGYLCRGGCLCGAAGAQTMVGTL